MPRKLIKAQRNSSYGPPLVNQKYAPLENIDLTEADRGLCDSLMTARWRVLNSLGLLPQKLNLILPDWDAAIAKVKRNPPLVVISNNRSKWIKKAIDAGKLQLEAEEIEQFDNASDLRALTAKASQTVSPPIYAPLRIGAAAGERNVYMLVHAAEYETYQTNLAGTGITVVGWQFQRPRPTAIPVCGFGASRFAAIEFCKELRRAAGEPWDYAWLFDDNVVALTAFAGYVKVEQAMVQAAKRDRKQRICAGFRGGTKAEPAAVNKKWAEDELKAGQREGNTRGKQSEDLPPVIVPGLVQQAALWNIAELTRRELNFGPIFITSGEDVSIGKYFDHKGIPYLYYNGIKILKEETTVDGGEGAAAVQKGRAQIAELIAESEWLDTPPGLTPPPPIWFKAIEKKPDEAPFDGREQTLGRFVRKTVIPYASKEIREKLNDRKTMYTAMCQATEQTICKAIDLKQVSDPALDKTFKVNDEKLTEVVQVSIDYY